MKKSFTRKSFAAAAASVFGMLAALQPAPGISQAMTVSALGTPDGTSCKR